MSRCSSRHRDAGTPAQGSYCAAAVRSIQWEWSGTLAVPAQSDGGEARTFTGSASGVFPLLRVLDRMSWESLTAEGATTAGPMRVKEKA